MGRLEMMAGRDRMCAVLEGYLGAELARERANNIAQVLGMVAAEPADVARAMLARVGLENVGDVAAEVARAWALRVSEMEQVA